MEAPLPLNWSDFPDDAARDIIRAFRSTAGEEMVLRDNLFVESFVIETEKAHLTEADKGRIPSPVSQARGGPSPDADLASPDSAGRIATGRGGDRLRFTDWLKDTPVPKLWVRGDPGFIGIGRFAAFCERLKNQTELTVKGIHFLQESSGPEIGEAVADFVRELRR